MNDHIPDLTKMIGDTPRTESFNCYDNGCDNPLHAWGAFSAELERELNAANERIKRLEEAGDAILNATSDDEQYKAMKQWRKAEEAKL
jgi:hypothetical protein